MLDQNGDLVVVRKRGRPKTGTAMTAAQRKKAQRRNAVQALRDAREGTCKLGQISLTALYTELQTAVRLGEVELVRVIAKELEARAVANK